MWASSLTKKAAEIVFLLMLGSAGANPQTFNVKGNVSTSIGPVSRALVTVVDEADATRNFSALTDTSGKYQLDIVTSVELHENLPSTLELEENYPNPFSSSTSCFGSLCVRIFKRKLHGREKNDGGEIKEKGSIKGTPVEVHLLPGRHNPTE